MSGDGDDVTDWHGFDDDDGLEDSTDDAEGWRDYLSQSARVVVDSVNLRTHRVDLERVQRIHLNLDAEPMEFSAHTVAQMIQDVADNCDEDAAFTLHAVVKALKGEDEHHTLTLQQVKRGRFESPDVHEKMHYRRMTWLHWLAQFERQGIKTEAAVAEIAEKQDVRRSTVFGEIRKAEKWLEDSRKMFAGLDAAKNFENPRPAKSENG